jgi:hypothetical protein
MNDNILRHEKNGIEFFTLVDSGNSGISQTGIARLCGKSRQAIIKLEKTLVTKSPSKWLKDFVGKDLTLVTKVSTSDKKVRNATIYTAGFCAAVIKHYAYQGSEIAQESDFAIGEIGLTSYIQAKTGWLPEQYQSSLEARSVLERLILKDPKKAKRHFDKEWMEAASRITGYGWDGLPMASFIRRAIYDCFPSQLIDRLVDVNPYNSDGQRRQNYHYQHFCPELDDSLLKTHIRDVYNLMCIAQSQKHFWQLMSDRFGEGIQLDLGIE